MHETLILEIEKETVRSIGDEKNWKIVTNIMSNSISDIQQKIVMLLGFVIHLINVFSPIQRTLCALLTYLSWSNSIIAALVQFAKAHKSFILHIGPCLPTRHISALARSDSSMIPYL
ncbi:hypothetical protein F511_22983 [Dorcoceras hygrometricum]|uniref:Uncharacterized protein n=1 Tax=Dorcoceras hygrometricum TaxID=472368 RepID=A0A2Z7CW05_9LAMI|nr:hypothetical protein F511_22983 [Dorcoceras hygrometricum]